MTSIYYASVGGCSFYTSSGGPGNYGGGGVFSNVSQTGAQGAVRIIWPGNTRQFPSTRTANE
jgi:hypothetical protein